MKYAMRLLFQIAPILISALIPTVAQGVVWDVTPSIETTLIIADNISFQPKGHEEDEIVFGIKPALRVQGGVDQTQLRLSYGIDNLYYANVSRRNSSRQTLLGNGSAELVQDLFFINATGSISYQPITPRAAISLGTLDFSEGSTQVDTWSVSPYFQRNISRALTLRAGVGLNLVEYKGFLPDSFAREYFFSASSGPAAEDIIWKLDLIRNDTYFDRELNDSSRASAELDLKYKILPAWALTGRVGYVDYRYEYNSQLSAEPKGKTWRTGVAWLPSMRTVLELGVSEHFFDRAKYGVFTYQGRWIHWNAYYEEVVTSRRDLQTKYVAEQAIDPLAQSPIDGRFLTEVEEVFINKVARLTSGYKSDEFLVEVFGYRDRRLFQATGGREVVTGGGASVELFLSQRASVSTSVSQEKINSVNSTQTKLTDLTASLQRTFGKGLTASVSLNRNVRESNDPLFTDSEANLISLRMQMEF